MKVYCAAEVAERLPYRLLIECLRKAFGGQIHVPPRLFYTIDSPGGSKAVFGLMPAWQAGGPIGAKLLTIFPDNILRGLPTIHAQILLFDGNTGVPTAMIDGTEVTRRRTAAASALAASFLAHEQSEYLLIVGTGAQALHQALAHAEVRPIKQVGIWGRSPEKARAVAQSLSQSSPQLSVWVIEDLEVAARKADIVSCVTGAGEPVIFGKWLKSGAFVDLVGSHTPDRRECDDETVKLSRIYVDTIEGALAEGGDVLIPLRSGVIGESDIVGDLHGLCRGQVHGRTASDEITLFKSVGTALEDLAAAVLVASGSLNWN